MTKSTKKPAIKSAPKKGSKPKVKKAHAKDIVKKSVVTQQEIKARHHYNLGQRKNDQQRNNAHYFHRISFVRGMSSLKDLQEWHQHLLNISQTTAAPVIALVGRSNVGKSSFLNLLCGNKQVARTSKTPGRTQQINIFEFDKDFKDEDPNSPESGQQNKIFGHLLDLPGYGFAQVSKEQRAQWDYLMSDFFSLCHRLPKLLIIHLQDAQVPLQPTDLEFLKWLKSEHLQSWLVFNKIDKLKQNEKSALEKIIRENTKLLAPYRQIHRVSVEKSLGIGPLFQGLDQFMQLELAQYHNRPAE